MVQRSHLTPVYRRSAHAQALVVLAMLALSGCGPEAAVPGQAVPAREAAPVAVAPATDGTPVVPASGSAAAGAVAEPASVPMPVHAPPGPDGTHGCLAASAGGASAATRVHRWVDGQGIVHYSDRAPVQPVQDHRELAVGGAPPVTVEARGEDVNLPPRLQERAVADAVAIQNDLAGLLGLTHTVPIRLRIVFALDAAVYSGLLEGAAAMEGSAGAYNPRLGTIHVRIQDEEEDTFRVLRHEITHALVHEWVGNLPVVLNEGLATWHARPRAGDPAALHAGFRQALARAAPVGAPGDALVDLLAREGDAFQAGSLEQRQQRYLQAFALVALLRASAAGQEALATLLATQRADPCQPVAAEHILEAHWPGGLAALAQAWAAWLRAGPSST